jgi:hypothetical protein
VNAKPILKTFMWRAIAVAAFILQIAGLSACEKSGITGKVVDVQGEDLPGVAVTVEGTMFQALTNARGEYNVSYDPGNVALTFAKTGFTFGRLELRAAGSQHIDATTVQLWHIPPNKGVYLFEPPNYVHLGIATPQRLLSKSLGAIYGVQKWEDSFTTSTAPLLVAYKTSQYEMRLYRLELTEFDTEDAPAKAPKTKAWVPAESIPVSAVAIDEPQRQLMQIKYDGELVPAVYALHWGAFDGQTQIEGATAYVFRVAGNAEEAPPEQPAQPLPALPPLELDPE